MNKIYWVPVILPGMLSFTSEVPRKYLSTDVLFSSDACPFSICPFSVGSVRFSSAESPSIDSELGYVTNGVWILGDFSDCAANFRSVLIDFYIQTDFNNPKKIKMKFK